MRGTMDAIEAHHKNTNERQQSAASAIETFLERGFRQAKSFLIQHPDITVTESDKGHLTVVCRLDTLKKKREEFINRQIERGVYVPLRHHDGETWENSFLMHSELLLKAKTCQYAYLSKVLNPIFVADAAAGLHVPKGGVLKPQAFQMAKMTTAIKAHKGDTYPVRPIIAAPAAMGRELEDYMLRRIERLFQHGGEPPRVLENQEARIRDRLRHFRHIVGDSGTVREELETTRIPPGYAMYTVDCVDMYTNIDIETTLAIIARKFDKHIANTTSISSAMFLNMLRKLMQLNEHFAAGMQIFLQRKGLPMGGKLSYALSEILTSEGLTVALDELMQMGIGVAYVAKYVDDILICMREKVVRFEKQLHSSVDVLKILLERHTPGMPFTHDVEQTASNGIASIRYLNLAIMRDTRDERDEGQFATVKWTMQSYASGRFVNAWSAHKMKDKVATVMEKLRTAMKVTSDEHKYSAITEIWDLCKRNGYGDVLLCRLFTEVCTDENIDAGAAIRFINEHTMLPKPTRPMQSNPHRSQLKPETKPKNKRRRKKCNVCGKRFLTWNDEEAHWACLNKQAPRSAATIAEPESSQQDRSAPIEQMPANNIDQQRLSPEPVEMAVRKTLVII